MATQLQLRRGTTAENDVFTGAVGELTMDTDTNGLRIHDGNTTGGFDVPVLVAVQRPTADNNYTWYRKYSDGWVEQGGVLQQVGTSANVTITFPVEMANNQYSWNIGIGNNGTNQVTYIQAGAWNFTTTTMTMESYAQGKKSWQVSGMAA